MLLQKKNNIMSERLQPSLSTSSQISNASASAVPVIQSSSIDSDKFLPQSCLTQLIRDFYKTSSPQTNKSSRTKKAKKRKNTDGDDTEMLKEQSSNTIRVSKDARDMLPLLANEFIHYITTNATRICEEADKRTVSSEHILASLERTNFHQYLDECRAVAAEANQTAAKRKKNSNRLEKSGKSMEELEKEQDAIFEQARLQMMSEYEQTMAEAELQAQNSTTVDASCSVQLPDELADNDDYD